MKYLNKLLFALFLLPLFSTAQSNYKPGYIVNLKGDTVHGVIDYKEWNENPRSINFKKDLNTGDIESVSPKNARAFTINGFEYYQSFVLQVSQGKIDINNLSFKPDSTFLTDTVFLRIITKGDHLSLFSYTDDIKPRFYILETGEAQPKELVFQAFNDPNAEPPLQYINRYRTQLENSAQKYLTNTDKIGGQILQAKYSEDDLAKIVQTINGGSSQQFTTQKLSGTRWFAGLGANYSTFTIGGSGTVFGGNSSATSVFPKISAGLDFFGNKDIQRLIIRADISFTVNQFNLSNSFVSGSTPLTSMLNFKQYNTSITPQIIYNIYNTARLKVFIDGGIAFNLSSYNHYQTVTKFDGSSFPPSVQDNYPEFGKSWISFPIKAGIQLNKKAEISICYIPSSSLTSYSGFSGNITSYQVGLNYLFGTK